MSLPLHTLEHIATLALADGGTVAIAKLIAPLPTDLGAPLATELASMDPWRRYGFTPERLQRFVAEPNPQAPRYLVHDGARILGIVVVKPGWMFGSYLNFLAVLPGAQGRGIGGAVLAWLRSEGLGGVESNECVATSAFNDAARGFDEAHGFEIVARLPGLIGDDETEILLRRRLA